MSVDPAPLAKATANLMDSLEEEYGGDAEIEACVIVVEVGHSFDDEGNLSAVRAYKVECSLTEAVGVLVRGADALMSGDQVD